MSDLALFSSSTLTVRADSAALRFESGATAGVLDDAVPMPSVSASEPRERDIWSDLGVLYEQGIVCWESGIGRMEWSDWPIALELGARSLTAFSTPSHLILEVDRIGELGRPDFRYVLRWREGHREVAVERHGAYLRHAATDRLMHLDSRTLAMVEAMETFNALPDDQRASSAVAWGAFAGIRSGAAVTGALLDEYLESNVVLIPGSIGLTVRDHADGSVSFVPRLNGMAESEAFAAKFMGSLGVNEVTTLTRPDGQRVRVLLNEAQQEVLRRMRSVRSLRGEVAAKVRADPALVFDGVSDAIDLDAEYGPRVLGIGELHLPGDVREHKGESVLSQIRGSDGVPPVDPAESAGLVCADVDLDSGDKVDPRLDTAPSAPPQRSAISIDVLDDETGASITLRFDEEAALEAFSDEVSRALGEGQSSFTHQGKQIRVEPELADVLDRHTSTGAAVSSVATDSGAVGKSGHLYLLINDHESSLTEALLAVHSPPDEVRQIECEPPVSLLPGITLQAHQREGLDWLTTCRSISNRRGSVLADDMGLGKTLQLLAHIANLLEAGALNDGPGHAGNGPWRPVLIVAPLLLVENGTWTDEMRERFADEGRLFEPWVVLRDEGLRKVRLPIGGRDGLGKPLLDPARLMAHKVVITTYETLVAYQHSLAQHIDGRPMWSLVIFDEAQEIKSPKTKVSYAAKALDAQFKVAATGTPVETRLRDLWNLLDTVEPSLLSTQIDFVGRYERPAMNSADATVRHDALGRLRTKLCYQQPGALLLRRDKSILRNLPKRHEHRVRCELTALERKTNAAILGTVEGHGSKKNPLLTLQQLHLASQHPVLAGATGNLHDTEALIASSSRLRALVEILEKVQSQGEKALIFARSVDAQRLVSQVIRERLGVHVDVVNGQTGMMDGRRRAAAGSARRDMLKRFRETPGFAVIVLSPFVAGVGITLTEANHVIHYGRWWNPAIESQATDRAYRIGQTRDVHVYYPIGVDPSGEVGRTFDEALDTLITSRRALAQDFLVPAREESDARALYDSLSKVNVDAATSSGAAPAEPSTLAHIGALLFALAQHQGQQAAWLGAAGVHGAHLLVRERDSVQVIRIVETVTDREAAIAEAAVVAWERSLTSSVVRGVIAGRELASESATSFVRWSEVVERVRRSGVPAGTMYVLPPASATFSEALAAIQSGY